jgi:hypothetical protein
MYQHFILLTNKLFVTMKIISSIAFISLVFLQNIYSQEKEISDPKGAIIIADVKGAVSVISNATGKPLPQQDVQAGKLIFDGHTIKTTGKDSKIVLLLSNGTVTTLKADSVLNIKKFTQAKFNPGATKLAELKGEPSSSDTLINLNIGDMVVDIKKLDKKSNFNIESPVGTAGIRGTRIGMNIQQAPGGGFTSKVTVPEGIVAFTPPPPPPPPPGTPPPPPGTPPPPAPEPVIIPAGQSVTPSVTATGTISAPPVPVPAPPADLAAVNQDLDVAQAGTADITVAEVATAVETVAEIAPPPEAPPPTDPEPTDPEPTDPEPTDPEPTDPEPTDPAPTDPEPTDPAPTDPEPTDPAPTDPAPTDPAPTDPAPTDPAPTDPPPPDGTTPPPPDGTTPPPPDGTTPPSGPGPDAPPPPPPPPVDQTALRESNPVIKAKQKGIKVDDIEKAALANFYEEKGTVSADALSSDKGVDSLIAMFDPEEGSATKMRKRMKDQGLSQNDIDSMMDFSVGDSIDELVATSGLIEQTQNLYAGDDQFALADVTGFLQNIEKVAEISAKASESGAPLAEGFQKNLIRNAESADTIGNVDFNDPKALLIVDLKAEFPQFAGVIDQNKEKAQEILDLVADFSPGNPNKGKDIFSNPKVLEIYLNPDNQLMGEQLGVGYVDLLVGDPHYFESLIPILRQNPQLPSQLFVELKNLNLSQSELATVLSDIQVGPQATPPGTPPNQIAQLTLQGEAGMLGLLDDHSISGGVLDPQLFVAAEQVLASVFFSEANDAYDALGALDHEADSGSSSGQTEHDIVDELILGGRQVSVSTGNYALNSAGPVDFLIASTDKLTLMGNVVFNASPDSHLILLSAGTVDLSGLSSLTFTGEELGIGSFDSLEVKNVDLKSEDEIHLRSLDNIVINNVNMETSGKGADFIHLIAANELQVNNLYFSDAVKQIAMEAMTINLSHVNFPLNSTVNLKTLYGGMDGKYPNFNTILYGRVNFIEQIKYGNQLIMDRASFDAHGGNVTIGSSH